MYNDLHMKPHTILQKEISPLTIRPLESYETYYESNDLISSVIRLLFMF